MKKNKKKNVPGHIGPGGNVLRPLEVWFSTVNRWTPTLRESTMLMSSVSDMHWSRSVWAASTGPSMSVAA
jgi:hypothetical protein